MNNCRSRMFSVGPCDFTYGDRCTYCGDPKPETSPIESVATTKPDCGADREREALVKAERDLLLYWLLRAHRSGHREGWQDGPSVAETMEGIHDLLCNMGYDPTEEGTGGFPNVADAWMDVMEETFSPVELVRPDLCAYQEAS